MDAITLLNQDVVTAARELIGWTLVVSDSGVTRGGVIVETEAYRGIDDPAAHAYRGRTTRNAPMWEAAGTIYVYLSYGLHEMLNLVTGPVGQAEAVLIRALEPTVGLEFMFEHRQTMVVTNLASGPAKLTQALGIDRRLTGTQLGPVISLMPPAPNRQPELLVATTRIGISQGKDLPWRFYRNGNPYVSRPR